jgi:ABC-2 type transport system ATP-binding protein
MDHGKLLALDRPDELKRTVGADTILKLRTDGDPAALLTLFDGVEGVDRGNVVDGEVMVAAAATDGLLSRLIHLAEANDFSVRDVSVAEPTLETVFINLTGKELRE